jgi:hypothetical protein
MSGWVTVAGTLGGAVVGGGVGLVGERLRFRHDDRTRWLDLRRELAVRFLEATEDIYKWTRALSVNQTARDSGMEIQVHGASNEMEVFSRLQAADELTRKLHTEIDLVGTQAERDAAKRLRDAVWATEKDRDNAEQETMDALEAFRQTARRGLVPEAG